MAGQARAQRDKAMAAFLKKMGIERKTGQCPWGCGRPIRNGGEALLAHLNVCRGNPKQDIRNRRNRAA